jgi:hypothetical protein
MRQIILLITFLLLAETGFADSTFKSLQEDKKTSYLDFILLKVENKLIQRHALLKTQAVALRVQYQNVGTQVDYVEKESKVVISIIGIMDKERYSNKRYKPKITDCNVLRNILLYGKYGYNLIFQKRNKFLTNDIMEEIFISRFLNNLSITEEEKKYIVSNTFAKVQIIDPVKGNDMYCEGKIAEELN